MISLRLILLAGFAAAFALAQPGPGQAPRIVVGTGPPETGRCNASVYVGDIYIRSQPPNNAPIYVKRCTQTGNNTYGWQPIGHLLVTALPLTCAVGDLAFLTSAPVGNNIFGCTATDTWTAQGGGGGGAPPFSSIQPGTNTGPLVVGSGGSLSTSGGGTIVATTATTAATAATATNAVTAANLTATGTPNGTYCVQITAGVVGFTQTACPGGGGGGGTLFDSALGLFDSAPGLFDSH